MLEVIKNTHGVKGYEIPQVGIVDHDYPGKRPPFTLKDLKECAKQLDRCKPPNRDIRANKATLAWLMGDLPKSNEPPSFISGMKVITDETVKRGYFKIGDILYDAHMSKKATTWAMDGSVLPCAVVPLDPLYFP